MNRVHTTLLWCGNAAPTAASKRGACGHLDERHGQHPGGKGRGRLAMAGHPVGVTGLRGAHRVGAVFGRAGASAVTSGAERGDAPATRGARLRRRGPRAGPSRPQVRGLSRPGRSRRQRGVQRLRTAVPRLVTPTPDCQCQSIPRWWAPRSWRCVPSGSGRPPRPSTASAGRCFLADRLNRARELLRRADVLGVLAAHRSSPAPFPSASTPRAATSTCEANNADAFVRDALPFAALSGLPCTARGTRPLWSAASVWRACR